LGIKQADETEHSHADSKKHSMGEKNLLIDRLKALKIVLPIKQLRQVEMRQAKANHCSAGNL